MTIDVIYGYPLPNPWTRAIPQPAENVPNLAACVAALKETVESLIGQRGKPPNRAVTFNDLVKLGILSPAALTGPDGSFDAGDVYQPGPGLKIDHSTKPPTIDVFTPYLPLTGGTLSGPLYVNGEIKSQGSNAIFTWLDRSDNTKLWGLYAVNGLTRLYYQPVGDRVVFDTSGNVRLMGNSLSLNGASFSSGPRLYGDSQNMVLVAGAAGVFYFSKQDSSGQVALIDGNGNMSLWGNYLSLAVGLSPAPYPYLYMDGTWVMLQLGTTGNGGVSFRKSDGNAYLLFTTYDPGGQTAYGMFSPQRWRMRINSGDETNSGTFDYGGYDANAMSIVGKGTGYRVIRIYDILNVGSNTSWTNAGRVLVSGGGQVTAALNTTGDLTNAITLDSFSNTAGAGGVILFTAAACAWKFAAIIGQVQDGGGNSRGDIVFSTRRVNTDGTLQEAARVQYDGTVIGRFSFLAAGVSPYGQFRMSPNRYDANGYGSFWYNDSSNTYLLLTNNNDAWGSYNGLRPFTVNNASGGVSMSHGLTAQNCSIALTGSSASNVLLVRNAGGQQLSIYDDGSEHIECNTQLFINYATGAWTNINNGLNVTGAITSNGVNAILQFQDRGGARTWGWYSTGGLARLYSNTTGDRITVDDNGTLSLVTGPLVLPNNQPVMGRDAGGTARNLMWLGTDNQLWIGDSIRWNFSYGHLMPNTDNGWQCGIAGHAWSAVCAYSYPGSSDRRLKRDIAALPNDCLDLVRAIDPVRFRWRTRPDGRIHWGFIAQEVGEVMQAAGYEFGGHVIGDDDDRIEALNHNELIAVLWHAVQELAARIDA